MSSPEDSGAMLAQAFSRAPRMVGRRIVDEYILVPIVGRGAEMDGIFNLNGVAAFIWEQFDGRRDGHRIVEKMVEQFVVNRARAEADYLEFVGKLQTVGALIPGTGSGTDRSV